jgi:putative transcriptional regulator
MNEELEEKSFITITGRVSREYYEEKFYGMVQTVN